MKQTVKDIPLKGKRVLIRVDFNVPQTSGGAITDDTRIRASLPTIIYCMSAGACVILISHLGRPDGKPDSKHSLKPVKERLWQLLDGQVAYPAVELAIDPIGSQELERRVKALKEGEALLLENIRFYPQEEQNDPTFAKQLAQLGDLYVNDAFGSAHRAHASTEGVARHLPAVAGLLMEKEIAHLGEALANPVRPFIAVLGGAKVSDKIGVLTQLLQKVDRIVIGGGMAYTFLKAQGRSVGSSKLEADKVAFAGELLSRAGRQRVMVLLPFDHVITTSLDPGSPTKTTDTPDIPDGWLGADIGPSTIDAFTKALAEAKTVLWNGPVGVFEQPRFAQGSRRIAEALAGLRGATLIGGGDTAACVHQFKLSHRMSHISTGGGASLEFLEGKTLPGIAVLQDQNAVHR